MKVDTAPFERGKQPRCTSLICLVLFSMSDCHSLNACFLEHARESSSNRVFFKSAACSVMDASTSDSDSDSGSVSDTGSGSDSGSDSASHRGKYTHPAHVQKTLL